MFVLINDKPARADGPNHVADAHELPKAPAAARLLAMENELAAIRAALQAADLRIGPGDAARQPPATLAHPHSATAEELHNILASTGIATIALDLNDRIRFFTPATRSLFHILPSDIGRPLAHLAPFTPDPELATDLATVRDTAEPVERELETADGLCYCRSVLPCRNQAGQIVGVVITWNDITDRRHTASLLQQAREAAESANLAKSQFLSAASHDLRQPLQALVLLQELLAQKVSDPDCRTLLGRIDRTLDAMATLLDSLLDINRIEAGAVDVTPASFGLDALLAEIVQGLAGKAEANGLKLRWVRSGLTVMSDRRHLATMIRNVLANALKYTARGGVVIGARRCGDQVHIEVWDSGIGIPPDKLDTVFQPYQQLRSGNADRKQGGGMGLGLAIVRSLGERLGHAVTLRSRVGKGSVFSISVPLAPADAAPAPGIAPAAAAPGPELRPAGQTGARILVIDDDPDLLELLSQMLGDSGHSVIAARDEIEAMAALLAGTPDLIVSDFRLANGHDGLTLSQRLRTRIRDINGRTVPVVILTGDISIDTLVRFAANDVVRLSKPIRPAVLRVTIESLLGTPLAPAAQGDADDDQNGIVHVIDDDPMLLNELGLLLAGAGMTVRLHASAEAFRAEFDHERAGCLLIDVRLPGESGMDLMKSLKAAGTLPPAILITGRGDIGTAVAAMREGAMDFIEKPVSGLLIVDSVRRALASNEGRSMADAERAAALGRLAKLTARQRQVMAMVLEGHPSKNIAADLNLSQRTVENHRAEIMRRSGCRSLPELARLVMFADPGSMAVV